MTLQELLQNPDYKQKFVLEKFIRHTLNITREEMRVQLERGLTTQESTEIINNYNSCTIDKKPLEYILGHVDFFGIPFYVDENTIIPRPETEYMITAVTEFTKERQKKETEQKKSDFRVLLDIGTGSGVLGISILLQNPDAYREVFLTDISAEALIVAKKNYDTLISTPLMKGGSEAGGSQNYDTRFIQSNLAAFIESYPIMKESPITLVSNFPYIPDDTFDNNALENVQKREPRLAFVGGEDGLELCRKMFQQIKEFKEKKLIREITMFLEMMTWQVDILRKEFGDWLDFEEVKTFHFNIRIVKAWIK
ncbi:MAG: peptide chain release factor N(5)-glutamine methyltransferase [Candidatus Absconditabacteria bacterium]|nr:peptide chain release factor N(5)-glutamine methyltransferase [Candidatus Absconditabacteria bacterium]MDD3868523.1 peptide chain release factor N(5)-glutamine methyltransferase [Candidatus Absconditabacteria bacterium]MDD4714087.1 peptide chain release factor N(5)-glutamine methyltransferase [Candidatus Absconditabacteria bacterium]